MPELLLDARPPRMTKDADVTVVVESLDDFDSLKDRLGIMASHARACRTVCDTAEVV